MHMYIYSIKLVILKLIKLDYEITRKEHNIKIIFRILIYYENEN